MSCAVFSGAVTCLVLPWPLLSERPLLPTPGYSSRTDPGLLLPAALGVDVAETQGRTLLPQGPQNRREHLSAPFSKTSLVYHPSDGAAESVPTRIPPSGRTTRPGTLALPAALGSAPALPHQRCTVRSGSGTLPGGCGVSFGPLSSEDPGLGTSGQKGLRGQRLARAQAPLGRGWR